MATPPTQYTPPPLPSPFTHTHPPPTLLTQGAEAHLYKTISPFTTLTTTQSQPQSQSLLAEPTAKPTPDANPNPETDPEPTPVATPTPAALKIRPSKAYRHPILDRRLTRQRILQEARCLVKLCREGVSVPAMLAVDWEGQGGESGIGGAWLLMEWVEGVLVRVVLERWEGWMKMCYGGGSGVGKKSKEGMEEEKENENNRVRGLMRRIGYTVGGLHRAGVVHGDLTTSNLILRPARCNNTRKRKHSVSGTVGGGDGDAGNENGNPPMDGDVVLIDFGLAAQSVQDEDQAVDLYVLERAIGSTHPRSEPFFGDLLQGYRESYKGAGSVLRRLEDVRMRGRKRSMVG